MRVKLASSLLMFGTSFGCYVQPYNPPPAQYGQTQAQPAQPPPPQEPVYAEQQPPPPPPAPPAPPAAAPSEPVYTGPIYNDVKVEVAGSNVSSRNVRAFSRVGEKTFLKVSPIHVNRLTH